MTFKEIKNLILRCDRVQHKFIGDYAFLGALSFSFYFLDLFTSGIIAFIFTLIIAIGRELYNKYYEKKVFDWWDVFYTMQISILGMILIGYLKYINQV